MRACVEAVERVPVTAKIRAGGDDDARLEEIAAAAEAGGASLLTVHCRTRKEKYADTADWERLRRAVAAVDIPVCGNGGVDRHEDLARVRAETGCAYAMVGRGAMADPWIFSGRQVDRVEAARFLQAYAEAMDVDGAKRSAVAGSARSVPSSTTTWLSWILRPRPKSRMVVGGGRVARRARSGITSTTRATARACR